MEGCMSCINEREIAYLMGMRSGTDEIKCPVCQLEVVEKRTIPVLITEAHATAKEKGWWDKPRSILECLALVHSEVSEAVESYRQGNTHGIVEELADVLIRIFDLCGANGWDLQGAVRRKMDSNKSRSYRHGGKLA